MPGERPGSLIFLWFRMSLELRKVEDKSSTGSHQHLSNCIVGPHKEQLDAEEATNTFFALLFSKGLPLSLKGSRPRSAASRWLKD